MPWDLDREFDPRRVSSISAQDIFTDRVDEAAAFWSSLAAVYERQGGDVLDSRRPRRNVLVFYGVGGIGKTTLSRELEERFAEGRGKAVHIACRADFDSPAFYDLEYLLLHVRSALGRKVASWPAFDLALAVYWEKKHPGVPLRRFVGEDSGLRRLAGETDLPAQIEATVDTLLTGLPLISGTRKLVSGFVNVVREQSKRRRLLAECPAFHAIVATDSPDEMLPFLPALLAWDLGRHRTKKDIRVALFFDTWEQVQAQREELGGLEDLLARMAFLLGNVLIVITGRNRLSWGDRRHAAIRYSGAELWPNLVDSPNGGEPRQHLMGGLSDQDAHQYLEHRLVDGGSPVIPTEIRDVIVRGADGLPLYLDLSADHYEELLAAQVHPEPEYFGKPFPQLVTRLLRDLQYEERTLIRAAVLLGSFNPDLLAAAYPGELRHATLDRFLRRHFVRQQTGRWAPYSIHDQLRASVRRYDGEAADGWSPEEWRTAAEAAFQRLRQRLWDDIRDPASADRDRLVDGFVLACALTPEVHASAAWVYQLAYTLRLKHLPHLLAWPSSNEALRATPRSAVLADTALGMAYNEEERYDSASRVLRGALTAAQQTDDPSARFIAGRLSKSVEKVGTLAEAESLLLLAASRPSDLHHEVARKDLVRARFLRGHPQEALAWGRQFEDSDDAARRDQALDLLGWVYYLEGDMAVAERYFRQAFEDPELAASGVNSSTASRHLALALAWVEPERATRAAELAWQINSDADKKIGMAQVRVARALAAAGFASTEEIDHLLAEAEALFVESDDEPELWIPWFARLFHHVVSEDDEASTGLARRLEQHLTAFGYHPCLRRVVQVWTGTTDPEPFPADIWIDSDSALRNWREIVARRKRAMLLRQHGG
jgi:tetratricopeptide (TPR) repeat protein